MGHALVMLDTYGHKHTLRICDTYCFSAATMVARTRLNVTLCIHCLSCYKLRIRATRGQKQSSSDF